MLHVISPRSMPGRSKGMLAISRPGSPSFLGQQRRAITAWHRSKTQSGRTSFGPPILPRIGQELPLALASEQHRGSSFWIVGHRYPIPGRWRGRRCHGRPMCAMPFPRLLGRGGQTKKATPRTTKEDNPSAMHVARQSKIKQRPWKSRFRHSDPTLPRPSPHIVQSRT